jgi:hypothetical protein
LKNACLAEQMTHMDNGRDPLRMKAAVSGPLKHLQQGIGKQKKP